MSILKTTLIERHINDDLYVIHHINDPYPTCISLHAFYNRNMDKVIKNKTETLYNYFDGFVDKYMIKDKEIYHNSVKEFFDYIGYDIKENKKRI